MGRARLERDAALVERDIWRKAAERLRRELDDALARGKLFAAAAKREARRGNEYRARALVLLLRARRRHAALAAYDYNTGDARLQRDAERVRAEQAEAELDALRQRVAAALRGEGGE